jgi:hypothetical protein
MDDSLYDTSWILYSLPSLSTSLRSLLTSSASTSQSPRTRASVLDRHAEAFHNSLVDRERPRYEDEEEREKLGGLRACTWTRLAAGREVVETIRKQKRKRDDTAGDDNSTITLERGLLVSLVYDKATYKFAIFGPKQDGSSSKRTRLSASTYSSRTVNREGSVAIILAKASPAVFKALQAYLTDTFAIQDIHALKLPPAFLQSTLAKYISSIYTALSQTTSERQLPLDMKAIFGMIKISMSFSAPIAPSLKMLDIEVPSESVLTAFNNIGKGKDNHNSVSWEQRQQLLQDTTTKNVLEVLSNWIHERTGLKLPISQEGQTKDPNSLDHTGAEPTSLNETTADTKPEPPMRISRVLSAAYAISTEGRLKFALKSAETCDATGGGGQGGSGDSNHQDPDPAANVVRKANEALLVAAMVEARRQMREDA